MLRETDWNYYTEPRKGMKKGNYWPRGKTLGGSSAINGVVYMRGNRKDFDEWEQMGNPNWGWDSVLKYFKKSEDNRVPDIAADTKHHSVGGPLKIETYENNDSIKNIWYQSYADMGLPQVVDWNAEVNLGYGVSQSTTDKGTRCSAAKAFLVPAMNRPNLHIIKYAHVTKLEFNSAKSVSAVRFTLNGKDMSVRARKEVILSAGAVNSPKILLQSGIGPKKQLAKHNIEMVANLPVGRNLQDHLVVPLLFGIKTPFDKPFLMEDYLNDFYRYLVNRTTPFNGIGPSHAMAFISTVGDQRYPDIQMHHFYYKKRDPWCREFFTFYGYEDEIVESIVKANEEYAITGISSTLLRPKSAGKLTLRSSNVNDAPRIQPKYYENSEDMETVLRSLRWLQKMANTPTMKDIGADIVRVNIGACNAIEFDTDDYWRCYAEHMASTLFHPVGTTKMGPVNDKTAVVSPTLKVHGVSGLRVIDAGIMPNLVSANTNAAAIMIGEKGADLIKEEWSQKKDEL